MRRIECPTEYAYFRDEISPGLSEVLSKEAVKECQRQANQRMQVALKGVEHPLLPIE
jgi:hypothetical protein